MTTPPNHAPATGAITPLFQSPRLLAAGAEQGNKWNKTLTNHRS